MNMYLCSTVRNLLFAILKSIQQSDEQSLIFVIRDQQNIDPGSLDLTALPAHIRIEFITRKEIRQKLDSNPTGRFIRLLAALNIKTNRYIRDRIRHRLFNELLGEFRPTATDSWHLFLFNDRNRIARLFRLAFVNYAVIEDGLANYYGNKLKPLEKTWRILTRNSLNKRYIGDDTRCHTIFLLEPDRSPEALKDKVQAMTFINYQNVASICYKVFRFHPAPDINEDLRWIIATQPISVGQLTATGFDLVIYGKLIDHLRANGITTALKVHPREDPSRYQKAFPNVELLESKIPLELMILGSQKKRNIVSIYSTAGMGFEKYCKRITLIKDEESENMQDLFSAWRKDDKLLESKIQSRILAR